MKKQMKNKTSGITLIALVVTIIVLLLLAGVSIMMLTGENGILNRGAQSKERTERARIVEQAKMDVMGKQAQNFGEITEQDLKSILDKYGSLSDDEGILNKILTTTKGNYEIRVSEIYNGVFAIHEDPGLYNADTGDLIYSWDELLQLQDGDQIIGVNNGILYRSAFSNTKGASKVKLVITDDGTVTSISVSGVNVLKEIFIPASVTSVSLAANSYLETVKFDRNSTLTTIGSSAFYGCAKLKNINIPNSVVSIGDSAFNGCAKLNNINIPNSVVSIGDSAFRDCDSLESIELGEDIVDLGTYAFASCNSLKKASVAGRITNWNNPFGGCEMLEEVTFGSDDVDVGMQAMPNRAFAGLSILKTVEIKDSVTTICSSAFEYCTGLDGDLIIPNSVVNIGSAAFYNCTNIDSITIKNYACKVTFDKNSSFYGTVIPVFEYNKLNGAELAALPNNVDEIVKEEVSNETIKNNNNIRAVITGEVPIPNGFYYVGGTLDDGVVISDNVADSGKGTLYNTAMTLQGNQFVWVPVPVAADFVRYEGYKNGVLDNVMSSYTEPYNQQGTEVSEYNAMYASTTGHKGFYVARYEASQTNGNIESKQGKTVIQYVLWLDTNYAMGARTSACNMYTKGNEIGVTSTLIYGVQWDAIMLWIDSAYKTGTCTSSSFVVNSSGKGNFSDTIRASGNSGLYVVKNIYDLAGNVWEFTMEKGSGTKWICRGGKESGTGTINAASSRKEFIGNATQGATGPAGFRVALYL